MDSSKNRFKDLDKRVEIQQNIRQLRRLYLRYQEAEIVYSMTHRKLLEIAGKAGAIYRMDGTVLIRRDIFEEYLEQFHEPSTLSGNEEDDQ
ncbi:MAG: DUF6462 family protein [Anaerostipes sp.]|uniref:Uncharacterized protein n=1 Tax=Hespellia stercorisuis DSM 15480 TaxID=1121950 RepID=A0A1M6PRH1_9FIRM|nr:DUF6462 family protein [Hespellia stercorisuis]MDD3186803.1 DUF6462 family protein [Anaerostipes sp.]MDD3747522.1 DUF6462 family protein [Anaerostipes sp.]SHK10526.1 hypothetical protein SAMN02745243_02207 [Hespellia stercorisuis DSM 15480]